MVSVDGVPGVVGLGFKLNVIREVVVFADSVIVPV